MHVDDFGFEHILWIYSGRRGIHLWVCDEHARKMQNPVRKSIINYLSLNVVKNNLEGNLNLKGKRGEWIIHQKALAAISSVYSESYRSLQQKIRFNHSC
jgi:DNA primase catalytic subunit